MTTILQWQPFCAGNLQMSEQTDRLQYQLEPFSTVCKGLITRKPSYRWQTRATRKPAKNCSNLTCLQRCRWQYWPIFMRLAAVASEICEILRKSLKIRTYGVQGHPRSSILVPIESPLCDLILVINSNFSRICYRSRDIHVRLKIENCWFHPPLPCLTTPSGGTPLDIDVIYTPLKSALMGYNSVADITGLSSFV